LIVEKNSLPGTLTATAFTNDGIIMALRHRHYPVYGVQFHPESILTSVGPRILKNWLDEVRAIENSRTIWDLQE
jgi:anthranilate/para-aminobenzoate synthase component II